MTETTVRWSMTIYLEAIMFRGKVPPVSAAVVNRIEKSILREEVMKEISEDLTSMRSIIALQRQTIDSQRSTILSLETQLKRKSQSDTDERVVRLNLQVRKLKRIAKQQKDRIKEVRNNLRAFFGDETSAADPSETVSFH